MELRFLKEYVELMKREGITDLELFEQVKIKMSKDPVIPVFDTDVKETKEEKRERLKYEKEELEERRFFDVSTWDQDSINLPLKGVE